MYKAKSKKVCEHPDKLKGKPEECTPEQIEACHGQTKQHLCPEEIVLANGAGDFNTIQRRQE